MKRWAIPVAVAAVFSGFAVYVAAPWQGDVLSGTELRGVERCRYDAGREAVVQRMLLRSVNDGGVTYEVSVSVENDAREDPVGAVETMKVRTPDGVSRRTFDVVVPMDRILWDSDGYRRCMYSLGY